MCKVPRRSHTGPLFYSLGILKLFYQIQCHNFLFLLKILNNNVPESVCETFALMLHSHNTRSTIPHKNIYFFYLFRCHTSYERAQYTRLHR